MGELLRSEQMSFYQTFLPTESAYFCVAELGELGLAQFKDMTPEVTPFQRKFINDVRRCDEMDRRLRFLSSEISIADLKIVENNEEAKAPSQKELLMLSLQLENLEKQVREMRANEETLQKNFIEASEFKHVLRRAEEVHLGGVDSEVDKTPGELEMALGTFTGAIRLEKFPVFERILWRITRGNALVRHYGIEDESGALHLRPGTPKKVVFIIFFQGDTLRAKIRKVCDGFGANLYSIPENSAERHAAVYKTLQQIEDLKAIMTQTTTERNHVLSEAAANFAKWVAQVRKAKAVFHTLNLLNLDITERSLIGDMWVPLSDLQEIKAALHRGMEQSGSAVEPILIELATGDTPPTYFKTNRFTRGFQNIVDAYGIATYREMNPTPYTIISFPFLFAVMFGDFGHGIIMFAFALALVLYERKIIKMKIRDEIFTTFFDGRYIILLMGLFSIYTGLLYNDCFSKSFNIFGSSWQINYDNETVAKELHITLDPNSSAWKGYPYPFGIDPVWQSAENKLIPTNSFKMKTSVIIGVFQMLFGVILSLFNHTYFHQKINIYCEFIPQMIFLCSIFLYLCIMIMFKWTHFGATAYGNYPGPNCAPSLLIGLINMVMFTGGRGQMHRGGTAIDNQNCANWFFYPGQEYIEHVLVIAAFICIPWMLIIKPVYLNVQHKKQLKTAAAVGQVNNIIATDKTSASRGRQDSGFASSAPRSNMVELTPFGAIDEPMTRRGRQDSGLASSILIVNDVETNAKSSLDNGRPKSSTVAAPQTPSHDAHGHEYSFSDNFIHQAIHTIEFCLGCISHTASYLRLWALSLAHSELTEVLWNMVFKMAFSIVSGFPGAVVIFVLFAAWACLTIAILVVMEGLSAFLHALRLHWVEFNSKFYKGEGHAFMPFAFSSILEQERDSEEAQMASDRRGK